jgi:hypothetical protein
VSKPARTALHPIPEGQVSLQYFSQILDIDTVCSNALRTLRASAQENHEWIAKIQEDEWMFKCSVPVSIKY